MDGPKAGSPYPARGEAMTGKFSPFVIKALVDTTTGGSGNDMRTGAESGTPENSVTI